MPVGAALSRSPSRQSIMRLGGDLRAVTPHRSRTNLHGTSRSNINLNRASSQQVRIDAEEPAPPAIDRDAVIESIKESLEERQQLKRTHAQLQQRLAEMLRKKKAEEANSEEDTERSASEMEQRYASNLTSYAELLQKMTNMNEENTGIVEDVRSKLAEKKVVMQEKAEEFNKSRSTVISKALLNKTNKPIPPKVICLC
jgi:DNA repair exonuclease SbcCD ATPase subunit